jgi:hypothetical protein
LKEDIFIIKRYSSMAGEGCQSFFVVLFLLLNRRIRKGGEDAAGTTQYLKNRKVIDRGGDYVFGLKGNQGNLHKEVEGFFTGDDDQYLDSFDFFTEEDNTHGRKTWPVGITVCPGPGAKNRCSTPSAPENPSA